MYLWYTKKFDGKLGVSTSHEKPNPQPLSGIEPLFVQEVAPEHHDLSLYDLETIYPPLNAKTKMSIKAEKNA